MRGRTGRVADLERDRGADVEVDVPGEGGAGGRARERLKRRGADLAAREDGDDVGGLNRVSCLRQYAIVTHDTAAEGDLGRLALDLENVSVSERAERRKSCVGVLMTKLLFVCEYVWIGLSRFGRSPVTAGRVGASTGPRGERERAR